MKGRLFTSFAALCALLSALMLLVWARSYLPPDLHVGASDGRIILLFSQPGATNYWKYRHGRDREVPVRPEDMLRTVRLGQWISPETYVSGTGPDGKPFNRPMNVPPAGHGRGRCAVDQRADAAGHDLLPHGRDPAAVPRRPAGDPASIWLALTLRRRRLRAGLCRNCGYDLRETPGRCPECGTDVSADSVATSKARQAAA